VAEVEVWYLNAPTWRTDRYAPFVSDDERSAAGRFRSSSDAGRFLASRALARSALARRVDMSPPELMFDRRCTRCDNADHGRPSLGPLQDGSPVWHFSVTRAGPLVAVAIASSPIGLDAEPARETVDDVLGSSVFSDADRTWVRAGPSGSQSWRLLSRWVAKEAIGKASGLGLIEAARIVAPPLGEGWNPAADASGEPCWLRWLSLPDAVAAAVAIYDWQDQIHVRDGRDLGLLAG